MTICGDLGGQRSTVPFLELEAKLAPVVPIVPESGRDELGRVLDCPGNTGTRSTPVCLVGTSKDWLVRVRVDGVPVPGVDEGKRTP